MRQRRHDRLRRTDAGVFGRRCHRLSAKQIDGLAALVVDVLDADPFSSHLFVFCNRGRDKLKLLFWHHNGFWLWYRRLERERFWWPNGREREPVVLSVRELSWLLEGLNPKRVQAHKRAQFELL